MAQLIISSNNKNGNLKNSILQALNKHNCAEILQEDKKKTILDIHGRENLIIEIADYNSVCTYKNEEIIYVISSADKKSIKKMINIHSPVITCGTSPKDTISLASIDNGTAVVSLQRKIKNIRGEIIEPMDIKIKLDIKNDVYQALAACTALLLCGVEM